MNRPAIGTRAVHREGSYLREHLQPAYRWDGNPARPPRAGEYYLSGARGWETAYRARADLSTPYFIMEPAL